MGAQQLTQQVAPKRKNGPSINKDSSKSKKARFMNVKNHLRKKNRKRETAQEEKHNDSTIKTETKTED